MRLNLNLFQNKRGMEEMVERAKKMIESRDKYPLNRQERRALDHRTTGAGRITFGGAQLLKIKGDVNRRRAKA